jgi:hypothetical protein
MKTAALTRINTTSAKAAGHEKRPESSDLNIGCSAFGVGCFLRFTPKKYRPPRPMGVKGGCSPQNNLPNSAQLLPELMRRRNKNFL